MIILIYQDLFLVDPGGGDDELVLLVALPLLPQNLVLGALLAHEGRPAIRMVYKGQPHRDIRCTEY